MARRYKSLHHNLQPGENVVFHREHRSPRNRSAVKKESLKKYNRSSRRKFKNYAKNLVEDGYDATLWRKRRMY